MYESHKHNMKEKKIDKKECIHYNSTFIKFIINLCSGLDRSYPWVGAVISWLKSVISCETSSTYTLTFRKVCKEVCVNYSSIKVVKN